MSLPPPGQHVTDPMLTLPKVELHVHLEGTLEPELVFTLADRNGVRIPYADVADLRAHYEFSRLDDFIELSYNNLTVVQRDEDFYELTREYLRRAQQIGIRHAEVFFNPQAHTTRGIPLREALEGVHHALDGSDREFGLTTGLIVTFLRDRPASEAVSTFNEVVRADIPIVGVGLDSAEIGNPPSKFTDVFAQARATGLKCVAHAGEEGPPEYIWQALDDLSVARVDHGIRCVEDEALVDRLVSTQIPLTVCPLSNVKLRAVDTLADHPIIAMLERGLTVTVNSDDPAYFGGYLDENYRQLVQLFKLTTAEITRLARHAIDAAFLDAQRRGELRRELEAWSNDASRTRE